MFMMANFPECVNYLNWCAINGRIQSIYTEHVEKENLYA